MRQIWLSLIIFALVAPWVGAAAPAAETPGPTVTPEDHVLGKPDAPITIIEYGSLTCPHCAEFDKDTLPKLKAAWIDTGKAKLVFRGFPLNPLDVHAQALASCAPPDKYFAFIDTLYQNQPSWALSDTTKAMTGLENIGRLGGISPEQFKSCANDPKLLESIQAQGFTAGRDYQVDSTPTFFINGTKMNPNGAQPYAVFDKVLAAAQPTN
jgi:protein-disulfide isomerase